MDEGEETQHDVTLGVVADLEAAGFNNAEPIGQGGFGIVYRCVERHLGRTVAVKLLLDELAEDEDRERFLREQQAMARLSGHPNIVDIHQTGVTSSGKPFIVEPFCARGSLDSRLRKQGPLPAREVIAIGIKLAGALETAHQAGILHRDVKPSNILVNDYGEPQLTDFGIAHVTGGFITGSGAITGSPAFTAPEVLAGRTPSPAADVYSLGAVLFCLLTGHAVFERKEGEKVVAQFVRIVNDPIPDLRGEGIPAELCSTIENAMHSDPAVRTALASDLGEELRAAERALGFGTTEMAIPDRVRKADPDPDRTAQTYRRTLTPPVAATKYRPPSAAHALVARERLIETLREGGRRRLILIHAPAGFGKSTLAVQWRDELVRAKVPVAWLSVDNDDNNVVWFASHVVEAIRKVRPTLGTGLIPILESGGPDSVRSAVTLLLNEIHEAGEQLVLVVDDWHLAEDRQTIAAMALILDNGCHHLQIMVTSRSQSGLPLGRLRVRDELIEIDSEALRFDAPECHSFLVDRGGFELADDAVEDLRESTEGWIAALQLASLSMRGHRAPTAMIARITKDHRAVEEYLVENVLDSLEAEVLDFMLAISVTERICGDLAAVLGGVSDGQAMLDDIERRELFLRRTDEDWEWMRFHHMFRDYLRRRLHSRDPEHEVQLHKMASLWHADRGQLKEAVDHALAAKEPGRAADIVESHGQEMLERGQITTLVGLVDKLPRETALARSRLQLDVAWAQALLNHVTDSARALDRALAAIESDGVPADRADIVRAEAKVVQSVTNCFADRVADVRELVSDCVARPDAFLPFVVACAANCAAYADFCDFEFPKVAEWHEWALPYRNQTTAPFVEVYTQNQAGLAAMEMLDFEGAEACFRTAMDMALRMGGHGTFATRIGGAQLGELRYLRGDLDTAEVLLDASHELGAEGGVVSFKVATFGTGALLKAARGDLAAARKLLDEGRQVGRAMNVPKIVAHMAVVRLKLGIDDGAEVTETTDSDKTLVEILEELRIRRLLLAGETDMACELAEARLERLTGTYRGWARVNAQLLLAECLATAGRQEQARPVLAAAVETCERIGLVRPVLDAGPHVQELVATL